MESQIGLLLVPEFPLKAPDTPRCTPTAKDLGQAIMNLKQLRIIREIVRSKYNVTEAAAALFTSQSGLSKHIKDLEEELGVELFQRRGKRLLGLTDPGMHVLSTIDRVLLEADNIRQVASSYAREKGGTLTIATTHTQSRYTLPKVFEQFRRAYENVEIVLLQAHPNDVQAFLLEGRADIGIATDTLEGNPDLLAFPSYSWTHCVVAPKGHPLLHRTDVTLEAVAQYPIVTYHAGLTGRKQIDAAFEKRQLRPRVVMAAIDSDVIKTYVELGFGVGIIASMAFVPARDARLQKVKAQNLFPDSTTSIAVRRGRFLRDYAYRFIEMCAPAVTRDVIRAAEEDFEDGTGAEE
jgi:LysR family transcriptional regulator, cys regulon transcriptional activator